MRKIEKLSKKNPVGTDGLPLPTRGKAKQAMIQQQKRQASTAKEIEKSYMNAITRHRSNQTQETRDRMEKNLKESNKRLNTKNEIFIVGWFQPKDDIERIEKQRAKEVQKRMAVTRKKAEKHNKELGITSSGTVKERKVKRSDPRDMPQGGGGVYKEGGAKKYARSSDMPQGGGGSYVEGKSTSKVRASDFQYGGGGNYQSGKSKKKQIKVGKIKNDFQL